MHPLHDYIAGRIAEHVRGRRVVVLYDPRAELSEFFREAAGGEPAGRLLSVELDGRAVSLFTFDGSFLQARDAVEPLTDGAEPKEVVLHVPGRSPGDPTSSLLMELEKAGCVYNARTLKEYARSVLRQKYDDMKIDQMLASDRLGYGDYVGLCRDQEGGGSLLKAVFDTSDPTTILASWLCDDEVDVDLEKKGAWGELRAMARARLGLDLPADGDGARLRAVASRYVLANEFREDLVAAAVVTGPAASALATVPKVAGKDELKAVRDLARRLRERDPRAYVVLADAAQAELRLDTGSVPGDALGAIDTFRFEEAAAAKTAFGMVAEERFEDAKRLVVARGESFWTAQDPEREAVWQVCRLMIELGDVAASVRIAVSKQGGDAGVWIDRYASGEDAWFHLDLAQRRFETLLPSVEAEIDEAAVAVVQRVYEDVIRRMTEGFVKAIEQDGWSVPKVLRQTRVWTDVVSSRARPVAYIFVDAMRFEMGHELADRLGAGNEVQLRPAVAALPSITPVGMAALLPGAAASFSVVQQGGRLGAKIDQAFLPDRASRQKYLEGVAPGVVQLELDEVISMSANTLKQRIGGAQLVTIHSTDIDGAGENPISTAQARRVMSAVIADLARALRNLAAAGVEDAVITADHGHLFFGDHRPPSMRMDAPGGDTVDLHRRCWIGRGGVTPPGSVRVAGTKLGYATDLEFVYPMSTAVFKAGGDLAFHHGGPSLQEIVVPVLTVKAKRGGAGKAPAKSPLSVSHDFEKITNRIFTIKIELTGRSKGLFEDVIVVRPMVTAGDREVAQAALAHGAELDNGRLKLQSGTVASIGFMLTDDTVQTVKIQVLDAETDAPLYVSEAAIPVRLGV